MTKLTDAHFTERQITAVLCGFCAASYVLLLVVML